MGLLDRIAKAKQPMSVQERVARLQSGIDGLEAMIAAGSAHTPFASSAIIFLRAGITEAKAGNYEAWFTEFGAEAQALVRAAHEGPILEGDYLRRKMIEEFSKPPEKVVDEEAW